jgi:hypothetical protein
MYIRRDVTLFFCRGVIRISSEQIRICSVEIVGVACSLTLSPKVTHSLAFPFNLFKSHPLIFDVCTKYQEGVQDCQFGSTQGIVAQLPSQCLHRDIGNSGRTVIVYLIHGSFTKKVAGRVVWVAFPSVSRSMMVVLLIAPLESSEEEEGSYNIIHLVILTTCRGHAKCARLHAYATVVCFVLLR